MMRALVVLLLLATVAWAEPVIIRGQPFAGPVSGRGDSTFVGLEALAAVLKVNLVPVGGGWYVSRSTVDPALVKVSPERVVVEEIPVESRDDDGVRMVSLKQFVLALGGELQVEAGRVSVVPPVPGRKTRRVQAGDVGAVLPGYREATELPGPSPVADILVKVNAPGQKVTLGKVLVPGKINVVYFYTPWSSACRQLTPKLEAFVQAHPEYAVLAVHIQKQGSPVAKQYRVHSVPAFLVFDNRGKVQARGEVARRKVLSLLSGS